MIGQKLNVGAVLEGSVRKQGQRVRISVQLLERAYEQRDETITEMKGDPLLKNLERDPRYAAFLKKMHLPA